MFSYLLVFPQAYSLCKNNYKKISLLSDLLIRRGEGVTSTTRRVGPELSKRLFLMMNSCDPEQTLDSTVWSMKADSNIFGLVTTSNLIQSSWNSAFYMMYISKFYENIILEEGYQWEIIQ